MENNQNETQYELQKIDMKNWATTSNKLIESTYKLSLQEQRMLLVMASKVQPSDDKLKSYRFRARDFIEILGNKTGTGYYSCIKETVKGLQSKTLTIRKDGIERDYSFVITAIYEENEGFITLQFHPDLKDFFLRLKEKFTSYQLENVIRLTSIYSIRIYEFLKQYERLKKHELSIGELRNFLGIEPTKYKQYGHFKSKVLLVAKKEINQRTDINFDFIEIKSGRKVTAIKFNIDSKALIVKDTNIDKIDNDMAEVKALGKQLGLKLNDKLIAGWLNYGKENLIDLMNEIKYKAEIENPIGFITSVLPTKVADTEEESPGEEKSVPKEKAIREFISEQIPNQKVDNLEVVPSWIYQKKALQIFEKYLSEEEAKELWSERQEEILEELDIQRRKKLRRTKYNNFGLE